MGRSPRGRRRQFILAPRWERIARVRNRFRKGNPWLRFPSDEDGEPIVLCTKSLGLNHEVLTTYFTSFGLKSMNIKPLQREVNELFSKIPYAPECSKEAYKDGWNIRQLASFCRQRQRDAERRKQRPRDPNVRKLFQILKELKKDSHRASKGENESDVEEEAEEEQSEDGSQDSPSDFEPDGVPGEASVGHEGVTAKPPKKLPSSGSGRSKERAQMDLVNHEIHELEEQLKALGCEPTALPVEGEKEPKPPVVIPSDEVIQIPETPEPTERPFKRLRRMRSKQPEVVAAVNPDKVETQPLDDFAAAESHVTVPAEKPKVQEDQVPGAAGCRLKTRQDL